MWILLCLISALAGKNQSHPMTRKWLVVATLLLVLVLIWFWRKEKTPKPANRNLSSGASSTKESLWMAPDSNLIPRNDSGELIRYGKKLISSTPGILVHRVPSVI